MQLSDFRLKVFLFFILVYLYLQMFNQFDQANTNTKSKNISVWPPGKHCPASVQVLSEVLHSKVSFLLCILKRAKRESDNPCVGSQLNQGKKNQIFTLKEEGMECFEKIWRF